MMMMIIINKITTLGSFYVTTDDFSVRVTKITWRIGVSWTHGLLFCFWHISNSINYGHIIKRLHFPVESLTLTLSEPCSFGFNSIFCPVWSYSLWLFSCWLGRLRDHLRDVPMEDIFKLGGSAAGSEICEWVQVGIVVYIPHRKYQVKPQSSPWF